MAARLPSGPPVVVIRPGDLGAPPASVNPLEPAAGPDGTRFPLQAHADLVRGLFLAAFEADEPFPQVLAAALARCYEQAGWDLVTGEPAVAGAGYPSLADLQAAANTVVEEIGYGREITDNVRGFVRVRIGSLRLGTAGRFLGGGHPLDFGALLSSNVVLEIEDCGDDKDKGRRFGQRRSVPWVGPRRCPLSLAEAQSGPLDGQEDWRSSRGSERYSPTMLEPPSADRNRPAGEPCHGSLSWSRLEAARRGCQASPDQATNSDVRGKAARLRRRTPRPAARPRRRAPKQ
jgi:hypothetical protein